jgi:hypothetical protein
VVETPGANQSGVMEVLDLSGIFWGRSGWVGDVVPVGRTLRSDVGIHRSRSGAPNWLHFGFATTPDWTLAPIVRRCPLSPSWTRILPQPGRLRISARSPTTATRQLRNSGR